MNNQKYHLQKSNFLGGYALHNHANGAVSSSIVWSVPIDANTSIIRMYSDNFVFAKYNGTANSSFYDYFIPGNTAVDIYNIPLANTISFIADSANASIKVTQY